MNALPYANPAFIKQACRALYLARGRLAEAVPARTTPAGRWVVDNGWGWKLLIDGHCLPDAIQEPDGKVREVGSGLLFDSRIAFLTARGAAPGRQS